MLLSEATKKANTNQGIRRKKWGRIYIIPTDLENCCEFYVNNKFRTSRWNPKREDLIASDWEIVTVPSNDDGYLIGYHF